MAANTTSTSVDNGQGFNGGFVKGQSTVFGPNLLTPQQSAQALTNANSQTDWNKLQFGLSDIYAEAQNALSGLSGAARTAALTTYSSQFSLAPVQRGYVTIDAFAKDGDGAALLEVLQSLGLDKGVAFGSAVSGRLPIDAIDDLGAIASLSHARPVLATTSAGSVTSLDGAALQADVVSTDTGFDGTGITIGVLSDSFNTLGNAVDYAADIASGDLPGDVLLVDDSVAGSDEGRAMAQLIHDIAPGADLAFHTAFGGAAAFAQGIIDLANAGADIIVDDVIYFAEPMFQDGIIAQAVDTVDAMSVAYFSSAGNNGDNSFEDTFRLSGVVDASFGELHDWDPGAGVDTALSVTIGAGQSILFVLQWDEPFGASASDVDIILTTAGGLAGGGSILAGSASANVGGDPLEIFAYTNTSGAAQALDLNITLFEGAAPSLFKIVDFDGGVVINEYLTLDKSTSFGHANAEGALAVGAAFFADTPEFGPNPPLLEDFSSEGGVPILFDVDGNRLAEPEIRDTVDFTATDGGNTTFFGQQIGDGDDFPNFFGTSAAAPNAAAVAALLLQAFPDATPDQIEQALESSAIDIVSDFLGAPLGEGNDFTSGAGLIQADAALAALEALLSTTTTVTVLDEGFETNGNGTRYTTSVPEFSDLTNSTGEDFFIRTDGANIGSAYAVTGFGGDFFFAGMDLNGESAAGTQTLSFSGLDISGLTALQFAIDVGEDDASDGAEDWDSNSALIIEYQIDGGGFQNLLAFQSSSASAFNTVPRQDTDFDGLGDGTELTPTLANFSAAIAGTGSLLDIRITFSNLDDGDEDVAIDNIVVTGESTVVGEPNEAPVVTIDPAALAATEQTALDLKGTVTIADPDAGTGVLTATIAVDYGVLDVTLGTSGATVFSGNGTDTLLVEGTLDQLNALLGSDATSTLTYTPDTDAPPASANLSVSVNDNGNTGSGGAQTGSDSETIAITAVDDPAALVGRQVELQEDQFGTFAGQVELVDPDGTPVDQPTFVASTIGAGAGLFVLQTDGNWTYSIGESAANSNFLQRLNQGELFLDFTALFRTTTGDVVRLEAAINGVNDLPTSSDRTVTTDEDVAYTFSISDFAFSDVDRGSSLQAVRIDTLTLDPDASLELNGTAVTAGQEIAAADLGLLVFTPGADENGAAYSSFTFSVGDGLGFAAAPSTITIDVTPVFDVPPGPAEVFINEIHYDTVSSDQGEGLEVAGPAGTNLAGWTLVLYNGNGGVVYDTVNLSGIIPDLDDGYGTLEFPRAGIQNGSPDGVALVDPLGNVVQFLSYEGTFVATNGPAEGLTSQDIGVSELSAPAGTSLQLTGTGFVYDDFTWATSQNETFGGVNAGQDFAGPGPNGALFIADASVSEGDSGTTMITFAVFRAGGSTGAVTADYAVVLGGAFTDADGSDIAGALVGTVSFADGETFQAITLDVVGDTLGEPNEFFDVVLSNPTGGAIISIGTATGTILNDDPLVLQIGEIQGAGHTSLYVGNEVTTSGIVTATASNGFYLQDAGDGDSATSDGIFVFTSSVPTVFVGDGITVKGTVSEFRPGGDPANLTITQLTSPTITVDSVGNALPGAVVIGPNGITPPTEVIEDDGFTSFDPLTDGIDFWESLEGMRVTVENPVAVDSTNGFGELWTVASDGAGNLEATNVSDDGLVVVRGGEDATGAFNSGAGSDFNPERIQIEDAVLNGLTVSTPILTPGTVLNDVTGIVSYAFENYELLPTAAVTVAQASTNVAETTSLVTGAANQLSIATYNVLNLDINDADGDSDVANGRLAGVAFDIGVNLSAPDIVVLQEVQDDSGSANDGTISAQMTLEALAQSIFDQTGVQYSVFDNPFAVDGETGGQPGGNIRVAFLYRDDRVDLDEASVFTITDPDDGELAAAFQGSRAPLGANFTFNGETVTVIGNHFSSKIGSNTTFSATQPPLNAAELSRAAQAAAVNAYVDGLLAANPDALIAVAGDFNEFQFEEPLGVLTGELEFDGAGVTDGGEEVLQNLTFLLAEEERYSALFEGNAQQIDHIFISAALTQGAQIDAVHTNTILGNINADHDPILALLNVGSRPITGTRSSDTLNGNDGNDIINGDAGNDTINGRGGDDAIIGGTGNDTINGGDGDDSIDGGYGADIINGGNGNDTITDEFGRNTINGGDGDDTINGGEGVDTIKGDAGNDTINGGNGNDVIEGGSDNDTINGQVGRDVITGGNGNDIIDGGDGDDTISGGYGADIINGGIGNDTITDDFGRNILNGDDGDDTIRGGEGTDTINGGAGDDMIEGGNNSDVLAGDAGNDTLNGQAGNDRIDGGLGLDVLSGGAGNDTFVLHADHTLNDADIVTDFTSVEDRIRIEGAFGKIITFTQAGANTVIEADGVMVATINNAMASEVEARTTIDTSTVTTTIAPASDSFSTFAFAQDEPFTFVDVPVARSVSGGPASVDINALFGTYDGSSTVPENTFDEPVAHEKVIDPWLIHSQFGLEPAI